MLRWIIGLLILSPLLFGAALLAASEYGGETVQLETLDERVGAFFTTLWVVDIHEEPWLRAGDPESTWLKRLRVHPEVFLIRNGERKPYVAEVAEFESGRINYLMREKYGYADQIVSLLHDPDEVIAIRLAEPEEP